MKALLYNKGAFCFPAIYMDTESLYMNIEKNKQTKIIKNNYFSDKQDIKWCKESEELAERLAELLILQIEEKAENKNKIRKQ